MEQEFIPKEPEELNDSLELPDDLSERLKLTQRLRAKIVGKVTNGGTKIPTTDEELSLLMETLKQMDSTTLGEMRIKTDEKARGMDVLVQETIRELNKNKVLTHRPPVDAPVERVIPSTPELEEAIELVPDQDYIGLQSFTYDDFKDRFGNK